jgi:D-alanine-D-alanine ligase
MGHRIKVMVMMGGRSGEHEVSLSSARSILAVLDTKKYEIIPVGITPDGEWFTCPDPLAALETGQTQGLARVTLLPFPSSRTLYAIQGSQLAALAEIDVVFPALHGTFGEDGTLQGMLELVDLPYVGAGVLGSAVGMDKVLFKDVMRANGIPVLPSILATRDRLEKDLPAVIAEAEQAMPYPIFTKPANLGSSVGVTKCRSRSDLLEGMMEAARYDRRVLIEKGLEKPREIEMSVLGNAAPIASLPGEVIPHEDFYSYHAKYQDDSSELIIPAPLREELIQSLQATALCAYQAADCAGMARVDFLLDRQTEEVYLGEINTIPGFTRISMYPKLWAASGIPYAELLDRLIDLAMQRKAERDHTERHYGRAK